jgi:hypothetical protein
MRPSACGVLLCACGALFLGAVPGVALAQDATAPGTSASAPAAQSPTKPAPKRAPKIAGRAKHAGEAGAAAAGFETLADGSTRLFVELSQPVKYETKARGGVFTCVLKGAHVDRRNNYNPLVTVHFNTPVTSARLVPHGANLSFVVALRAKVTPTVTMDATKDGGAMLRLEFPKGDYVPVTPQPASAAEWDDSAPASTGDGDAPESGTQGAPPKTR